MGLNATSVLERARVRREAMLDLVRRLVDRPSGSLDLEGVAAVVETVAEEVARLPGEPFRVEVVREDGRARHVVARAGAAEGPPTAILLGHADTVFPKTDRRTLSVGADGRTIHGPGAADMKGGLVVAIEALRLLGEAGVRPRAGAAVSLLVNGDEEIGSPASRGLVRERSRGARAALVFEPAESEGAAITFRKGLGQARVRIRGRAAHAGVAPELGVSAIHEMAHQIIAIQALPCDLPEGSGAVVTVGLARGGTSRNTVPAEAELEVDLRYGTREAGERLASALRRLAESPCVPGARVDVEVDLHRPPMVPTEATERLFALAVEAGAAVGERLAPCRSGGGSDGNLAAAEGVPTIDGLGVVGGKVHTKEEFALVDSLPRRAALAALLIEKLLR